jgi:hypothetical protein
MAKGWVWPADGEDEGAVEQSYAGAIHMGQLVTIPTRVDLSLLGLSPVGMMIAKALQRYGAYVVDSGGAVALYAEPGLESQVVAARADMTKLRALMQCATPIPAAAPYTAAVKADHPVAYYRLDETGGTKMASQVGPGADGSYFGAPVFGQAGALAVANAAVVLQGADGARIPVAPRQSVSMELWVKSTDTTGADPARWWTGEALVDGDAYAVAHDYGTSLVAGKVAFHVGDTDNNRDVTIASTQSINDGAWHQVVATRDGLTGALAIYVDGRLDASGAGPQSRRYAVNGLTLGSLQSGPGDFLRGTVDEVAIYNQPLSAAAVARHYAAARP